MSTVTELSNEMLIWTVNQSEAIIKAFVEKETIKNLKETTLESLKKIVKYCEKENTKIFPEDMQRLKTLIYEKKFVPKYRDIKTNIAARKGAVNSLVEVNIKFDLERLNGHKCGTKLIYDSINLYILIRIEIENIISLFDHFNNIIYNGYDYGIIVSPDDRYEQFLVENGLIFIKYEKSTEKFKI